MNIQVSREGSQEDSKRRRNNVTQLDEALKLSKRVHNEEQAAKTELQTILQRLNAVLELNLWFHAREFELDTLTAARNLLTKVHDGLQ